MPLYHIFSTTLVLIFVVVVCHNIIFSYDVFVDVQWLTTFCRTLAWLRRDTTRASVCVTTTSSLRVRVLFPLYQCLYFARAAAAIVVSKTPYYYSCLYQAKKYFVMCLKLTFTVGKRTRVRICCTCSAKSVPQKLETCHTKKAIKRLARLTNPELRYIRISAVFCHFWHFWQFPFLDFF